MSSILWAEPPVVATGLASVLPDWTLAPGPVRYEALITLGDSKVTANGRVGCLICLVAWAIFAGPINAGTKPVLVHYMPWFVAKPHSPSWGWHWTMNHFNPDTTDALGQRRIASWYYPQIGPYDSADSVVLEYHTLLMRLAGIDGVIVDWYGPDNYADYRINNDRTLAILGAARRAGLSFALCYEDSTIQQEITGKFLNASNAVSHAQQTIEYARTNYFLSDNYFRFNNRPVLLNFGPQYFKTSANWQVIFSGLSSGEKPSFFTEDNRLSAGTGAFDWPPMYLSQTNAGVLTSQALESYLERFQQNASTWPAFISTAFPRYHDIYHEAGLGYSNGMLDDNQGETFRSTLVRALTNQSAFVQIATWNDFGEGTVIEPTVEFGIRDLGVIQDFRRQYLDPNFAHRTNDLALPLRLYNLRRQYAADTIVSAELDRVFAQIAGGNLTTAGLLVNAIESRVPVIYDVSRHDVTLQFSVGGYLSPPEATLQTTTNQFQEWQTVGSLPVTTNTAVFSVPVPLSGPPAFFRVKN